MALIKLCVDSLRFPHFPLSLTSLSPFTSRNELATNLPTSMNFAYWAEKPTTASWTFAPAARPGLRKHLRRCGPEYGKGCLFSSRLHPEAPSETQGQLHYPVRATT